MYSSYPRKMHRYEGFRKLDCWCVRAEEESQGRLVKEVEFETSLKEREDFPQAKKTRSFLYSRR